MKQNISGISKFIIFMLCLVLGMTLVSCGPIEPSKNDTVYTTDVATSPELYAVFINKEIEPITNVLVTQMGLADKVASGEYPVVDALDSLKSAIRTIENSKKEVEAAFPPAGSVQTREGVLQTIVNILNTLDAYQKELTASSINSANLKSLRNVMEGDYITLTGYFNVYNK